MPKGIPNLPKSVTGASSQGRGKAARKPPAARKPVVAAMKRTVKAIGKKSPDEISQTVSERSDYVELGS